MGQFLRFGVVGVIGFLVDSGVLYVMLWLSMGFMSGRIVSFLCAATTTWYINRRITFSPGTHRSVLREWVSYLVAMSGGGLVNLVCYRVVMSAFHYSHLLPLIAVGVGSIAGLLVNYTVAKFWVFRRPKRDPNPQN
ncbi:GtrA family protein [Caballeronia sp. LZ065]|uniref:GtrA family protein n=1 Tax=Caballeronia sp. LZ065 TaxID=3038571 RepID=UPI0028633710|nr:GtrA family protein [Caballeronia sp. LZ065]MDR5780160.1 GtrA family protein [Caballeronia sp. LZ065]